MLITDKRSFKKNLIDLRWLTVTATGYMAIFSNPHFQNLDYVHVLVVFFVLSNIALYFVKPEKFESDGVKYSIFLADIALVSLNIYLTRNFGSDLFFLYFIVIVITALGQGIKGSIIATFVASLVYFILVMRGSVNIYDVNLFLRIPFLFVIGLFSGFLVEDVKKEKTRSGELELLLDATDAVNRALNMPDLLAAVKAAMESVKTVEDWDLLLNTGGGESIIKLRTGEVLPLKELGERFRKFMISGGSYFRDKEANYFHVMQGTKSMGALKIRLKENALVTKNETAFFMTFENELVLALERLRLYEELRRLSEIDRLTGLLNYGRFLELLDERIKHIAKPFVIVMMDSDNFKTYNDTYGHIAGNTFLKSVARELEKIIRKDDIVARYGGDEFVLLLETVEPRMLGYIKEIKSKIENSINLDENKIQVTFSIGYAVFPQDGRTSEGILAWADKSLYKAKSMGKNRVAYL